MIRDISKDVTRIFTLISEGSRLTGAISLPQLAKSTGISPSNFSPSQKNRHRYALDFLLRESFIGKIVGEHKSIQFKPVKPIEDLDAMLASTKWDRRQQRTRDKAVPVKRKYVKKNSIKNTVDLKKAKRAIFEVNGIKITIEF